VLVETDIKNALAAAEERKEPPREAWLLQCVQEDRSNPIPCTAEDKKRFGKDGTINPYLVVEAPAPGSTAAPVDPESEAKTKADQDDLMRDIMGDGPPAPAASAEPAASAPADNPTDTPPAPESP
jgi:hypothetical protein